MARGIIVSIVGLVLCAAVSVLAGPLTDIKPLPTCPKPPRGAFDKICVDLSNGQREAFGRGMGLRWEAYQPNQEKECCSDEARIRIDPPCWAKSLKIDETSVNSDDWTFNLGDSVSNNGWAGDSGHETHDAEAQILNGVFSVYKSDHCQAQQYTSFSSNLGATHSMSLRVTRFGLERQSIPASPSNFKRVCNDKCLFEWDTMYLGMNRVVAGGYRDGRGLCQVCFTWEARSFCDRTIVPLPYDLAAPVRGEE